MDLQRSFNILNQLTTLFEKGNFIKILEIEPRLCIYHKTKENKVLLYEKNINSGCIFPPIEVVFKNNKYYVKDGAHRVEASKRAGVLVLAQVFDEEDYPNFRLIGGRITWKD